MINCCDAIFFKFLETVSAWLKGGMSNMNARFQADFESSKTEIAQQKSEIKDKLTSE